jgi:hypothetical protein
MMEPAIEERDKHQRQPALYRLRGNDISIITKVSELIIKLLNLCIQHVGDLNQETFIKANKALLVVPSILQMIQDISKNRKLVQVKEKMSRFLSAALEEFDAVGFIARILDEYDRLFPIYINLIKTRKRSAKGSLKNAMKRRITRLARENMLRRSLALAEKVSGMAEDATSVGRAPMQGEAMRTYLEGQNLFPDRVDALNANPVGGISGITLTTDEVADTLIHLNRESR